MPFEGALSVIEDRPPGDWRELQTKVAQLLTECALEAGTDHRIMTARDSVNIDVYAA